MPEIILARNKFNNNEVVEVILEWPHLYLKWYPEGAPYYKTTASVARLSDAIVYAGNDEQEWWLVNLLHDPAIHFVAPFLGFEVGQG